MADLHLAFLRRAPDRRLRAVQFRDAGHRQTVRGHPRSAYSNSPIPTNTTPSSSSISACRRPRACRCACCPRRSTAFASSASMCRASACRRMPRRRTCSPARCCITRGSRPSRGPFRRRASRAATSRPCRCWARCFPVDPVQIGGMLDLLGLAAGPVVPTREWRELYGALDCAAVAAHASVLHRLRSRVRGGGPHGRRLCAGRLRRHGRVARGDWRGLRRAARARSTPPRTALLPAITGALAQAPIKGRITLSGYEGSELLVGAAAGRERRGCALCRHGLSAHAILARTIATGSRRRASTSSIAPRWSRISRRCEEFRPDLAIGTTPVVQKAKRTGDSGALFHQPDFRAAADGRRRRRLAGARSINAALGNQTRFDEMKAFFAGVGEGYAAGVWEERPARPARVPDKKTARQGSRRSRAEEMGAC